MIYRIMYSFVQSWRYRKALAGYANAHSLQVASIVDLSPQALLANGIKGLIIDFDGVLASHAKEKPIIEAERWLQLCCEVFSQDRIFILSNNPTLARQQYFAQTFPSINFIIAKYKKPFPYSILQIAQNTELLPAELLVIDDRLGTGILAAMISKAGGCLITKPYIDYMAYPVQEKFEVYIRSFEQWLFKG